MVVVSGSCVLYSSMLCVFVMKLAECTGEAAQSLLSSHGMAEYLRREHSFHAHDFIQKHSMVVRRGLNV